MKNKLLKSIFSSGLQAIAVQIIGVAYLFIISFYLSKDDFGIITTLNSMAMMLTTILSFGLEQVVVRRIAASKSSQWAAAAYLFHAFAGSVLAFGIVWLLASIGGESSVLLKLLPWFFAAQAIMYIGTPLKQFLNARQQFIPYGVIAFISNVCKIILAFVLLFTDNLTIDTVYMVLIACAMIELVGLLSYVVRKTDFHFRFKKKAYGKLLKEAMPQYLVVIFDSSLSRIDVILLGLITTNALTGEYGFAYRAFELTRLPIVIIAPIILVRFSRMLANSNKLSEEKSREVATLFSIEMFLAVLIPLTLNILWSPLLDYFSQGKYGSSNALEFLILSVCIPFQFAINILWTLAFAARKYKAVSTITIITAVINLLLNLAFIPLFNGVGAASVFLGTTILQAALYYQLVRKHIVHLPVKPFIAFIALGSLSYAFAIQVVDHIILQLLLATVFYMIMAVSLKLVGKNHVQTLKTYLSK